MTNKELADKLAEYAPQVFALSDILLEAARRLRELPDPDPEPLTLRALVEKHECLSDKLQWEGDFSDELPWLWKYPGWADDHGQEGVDLTDSAVLTIVRGIVKGMAAELSSMLSFTESWDWSPSDEPGERKWVWNGPNCGGFVDDELESIDHLLAAIKESENRK